MRSLIYALALVPTFAMAEANPAMVAALDSCLSGPQNKTLARDCIGVLTKQCVDAPEGGTTAGMTRCAMDETAAWDVLLNREYQTARSAAQAMDADDAPQYAVRSDTLLAAQRAWITFRNANCTSQHAIFGAGTLRQIIGADCHLQMTAERTLALRSYADMVQH